MRQSFVVILADIFRQEKKHEINTGIGLHCLDFTDTGV